MRIAMIGQKSIPSRDGGVEIHVEETAARLAQMGHTVDVYCRIRKKVKRVKEYRGIRLIYIPTINTKHLDATIYSFIATVVSLFRKYDVYHYHAMGPSSMIWLPKLFGKKVICTVHGIDWKRDKWGKIGKFFLKWSERILFRYADEIIVLNENACQYFKKQYPNKKICVIPNGVVSAQKRSANLITTQFNLTQGSYILFLGRLVPEKGIHYLIKAFQQMKTDKKLVIAGDVSHSKDYVEKIVQLGSNCNCIFTGLVQGELLEELYSNAYTYVLPSDIEGMSIGLMEAFSYGCCCLVSDIDENKILDEKRFFTFKKGDVKDLKKKLEMLLNIDGNHIKEVGETARLEIEQLYSWDKSVELLNTEYERMVKDE